MEGILPREIQTLQEEALTQGYGLIMGAYGDNSVGDRIIEQRTVDGIIIARSHIDDPIYQKLQKMDMPFIVLHRLLSQNNCNYVGVDNRAAAALAVEHLISRGHKEIAFISGPTSFWGTEEKLAGYKDALEKHNLPVEPQWILHSQEGKSETQGLELALRLFQTDPLPRAIFASTDQFAFGVLRAARQKNIGIPRQLALIGFGNLEQSGLSAPPLTTISVPWSQMISLAISSLIQLIEHSAWIDQFQIKLKTQLIIRRST